MKRYLVKLISNPSLIFKVFYRKSLGIILSYNVEEVHLDTNDKLDDELTINFSSNVSQIEQFYRRNQWIIPRKDIEKWLSLGYECMIAYDKGGQIIGATWFWYNKITLDKPRRCYFSKKNTILLERDTAYICYELVDYRHRGKGIGQFIKKKFIERFKQENHIKTLIMTTGASNSANIRAWMKTGAKLIGITEVKKILNFVFRKEKFLDKKEKKWQVLY
ncbi:MAG: GNAT family N-acetyltransferase [Dethiobacteria bacterium]